MRNTILAMTIILAAMVANASCSRVRFDLIPLSLESRAPLLVVTSDLTGTRLDTLLAKTVEEFVRHDFLSSIKRQRSTSAEEVWILTVAQNPFRPDNSSGPEPIRVAASLERADYGPTSKLSDVIAGFAYFGLLGAAAVAADADVPGDRFIACLQCRFSSDSSQSVQPILVQVARGGNVRLVSRAQLNEALTRDAAEMFLFELARQASDHKEFFSHTQAFITYSEREAIAKRNQLIGR